MNFLFFLAISSVLVFTQGTIYAQTTGSVTFSAFADMYYAYDVNQPNDGNRSFTTQPLRHNEFNLNFAVISAQYASEHIRGRVALQSGTYVRSNYAAEPSDVRLLHEMSAGFRLADGVWVDMGIMPSHIGFESAVSKDNWNYSRSLVADYSPYYETGIKVTAEISPRITLSGLVLNGWQNIQENNTNKAIGTQLQWRPTEITLVNWSTFIGNEQPTGTQRRMRYFNNLFAQTKLSERVEAVATFDIGTQEASFSGYDTWWGTSVLMRYHYSDRIKVGGRVEYYSDPLGVLIPITDHRFRTAGASVNLDYYPATNMLVRGEARMFRASAPIFPTDNRASRYNGFVVLSFAVWM